MELAGVDFQKELIKLTIKDGEDIKDFIIRLEKCITNCRDHNIVLTESLLKSRLHDNTTGKLERMVLMRINEGKSYKEIIITPLIKSAKAKHQHTCMHKADKEGIQFHFLIPSCNAN